VSPTRGQQGNALQTILAMGYAINPSEAGETIIEAGGVAHRIVFAVDPIRQEPRISHVVGPSPVTTGTRITVRLPAMARHLLEHCHAQFLPIVGAYCWFNPHATITASWKGVVLEKDFPGGATFTKWRADVGALGTTSSASSGT
jgi:hypothetical protein